MKKIITDFIDRNKPIFFIGLLTAATFLTIILASQFQNTQKPELIPVKEENFISDHTPVKGPDDAKVVIIEFSDYECPACANYQEIVNKLLEKYPDDIQIAFRHFPLPQHTNARLAAQAAQAVHQQGKFWEYSKLLFQNQKDLSKENLIKLAQSLELNIEKFTNDLESQPIDAQISEDIEFGDKLGLNATPTFYVNGNIIETNLETEVRKEVERVNPEINNTKESSQSGKSDQDQQIDDKYGILEIRYTNNGFTPANTRAVPGQVIRFINETQDVIYLEQKKFLFKELNKAVPIAAGEYFEFRIGKLNMKDVIWGYAEKVSGNIGSTLIISDK
jgi:protein-disulfide isomerase